jgi:hypothetical protein
MSEVHSQIVNKFQLSGLFFVCFATGPVYSDTDEFLINSILCLAHWFLFYYAIKSIFINILESTKERGKNFIF